MPSKSKDKLLQEKAADAANLSFIDQQKPKSHLVVDKEKPSTSGVAKSRHANSKKAEIPATITKRSDENQVQQPGGTSVKHLKSAANRDLSLRTTRKRNPSDKVPSRKLSQSITPAQPEDSVEELPKLRRSAPRSRRTPPKSSQDSAKRRIAKPDRRNGKSREPTKDEQLQKQKVSPRKNASPVVSESEFEEDSFESYSTPAEDSMPEKERSSNEPIDEIAEDDRKRQDSPEPSSSDADDSSVHESAGSEADDDQSSYDLSSDDEVVDGNAKMPVNGPESDENVEVNFALTNNADELKTQNQRLMALNFYLQEELQRKKGSDLKFTYVKDFPKPDWLLLTSQRARWSDYIFVKLLMCALFPKGVGRATVTGKSSNNLKGCKMQKCRAEMMSKPGKIDPVKVKYIQDRLYERRRIMGDNPVQAGDAARKVTSLISRVLSNNPILGVLQQ